jgi:hypothetical protein
LDVAKPKGGFDRSLDLISRDRGKGSPLFRVLIREVIAYSVTFSDDPRIDHGSSSMGARDLDYI